MQYILNEKWVQNISNVEIMQETLFCGKKLIFEYLYVTGRKDTIMIGINILSNHLMSLCKNVKRLTIFIICPYYS